MPRRQLNLELKELKNTDFVWSVGLKRSFSNKEAYWVDVYRTKEDPTRKKPAIWYVVRQWSFPREGERVEGNTTPASYLSLSQAVERAGVDIQKKLDGGWEVNESYSIDSAAYADAQIDLLNMLSQLEEHAPIQKTKKKMIEEAGVPVEATQTQAERFEEKQKKRRAKAQW